LAALGREPSARLCVLGGMPYTTQCTKPPGTGASGSSTSRVSSAVPPGTPDHASGGETGLEDVQVYLTGIVAPLAKAGLVTVIETPTVPAVVPAEATAVGVGLVAGAGVLPAVEPAQAVAAAVARSIATSAFLTASLDRRGRSAIVPSRPAT
jgi:hypothetical protein